MLDQSNLLFLTNFILSFMTKSILTALGFLFSCAVALAQQNAGVKGRVMAAGKPVSGATVHVDKTRLGTITDTAGYFTIAVPQKDIFMLKISAVGYTTVTRQVKMQATEHLFHTIELHAAATDMS